MTHKDYMQLAIKVAKESEQEGGIATGAVLVKDEEIVATGKSLVWTDKDPSAHAELNCIRNACKQLNTLDLDGCILYGTVELCSMCLSCAAWANLSEIYFGSYRSDISDNKYEIDEWDAGQAAKKMKLMNNKPMKVTGGILREECKKLLENYKDWVKQ